MNFENKILSLFDHGRRSAVYVAGYQSARAQAASIAAEADRLIAEMAVENADLRERLSSLESLYRVRDKDCAAKEAELERVRTIAEKAVVMLRMSGYRPIQGSNNPLESWLFDSLAILNSASPAAELVKKTDTATESALSPDAVAAAMQRAWNDFCADAGSYPECFTVRGKALSADFSAGNFARFVARELKAQLAPVAQPARHEWDDQDKCRRSGSS